MMQANEQKMAPMKFHNSTVFFFHQVKYALFQSNFKAIHEGFVSSF